MLHAVATWNVEDHVEVAPFLTRGDVFGLAEADVEVSVAAQNDPLLLLLLDRLEVDRHRPPAQSSWEPGFVRRTRNYKRYPRLHSQF